MSDNDVYNTNIHSHANIDSKAVPRAPAGDNGKGKGNTLKALGTCPECGSIHLKRRADSRVRCIRCNWLSDIPEPISPGLMMINRVVRDDK